MSDRVKVDDVQKLAELLTSKERPSDNESVPDWADPSRYPRHVEVTDPDALAAIEQLDVLLNEMRQLMRRAETLDAKITIHKNEMYDRIESIHSNILIPRRGGSGLRDWRGKWWYVGWDRKRYQEENDDSRPGDGRGTYI